MKKTILCLILFISILLTACNYENIYAFRCNDEIMFCGVDIGYSQYNDLCYHLDTERNGIFYADYDRTAESFPISLEFKDNGKTAVFITYDGYVGGHIMRIAEANRKELIKAIKNI